MNFVASNMYCQYVIKTLSVSIKKLIMRNERYDLLEDRLYASYIRLEKLLNLETS
ncbi:MAG: hypothetical protein U0M66_03470 [Bacilli bacterium]|nr:hypothetical protein [Bacilli bacterium]